MASFLSKLISKIFGSSKKTADEMPEDGGLAEFAKQLAQELEQEEKGGKRPTVEAGNVLSVQHGRHGSKTYLLDTKDFRKAIAEELRDSVAPVAEGILKTRCGDKGTGFINVKTLYIFHVHREDPVAEYNAAMDIIDDIGTRLLGERYLKGDRKIHIPVAQVLPKDLFDLNGKFDFKKAQKSVDWVRDSKAHGPANVNWETGEVSVADGAPDWVPNEVTPIEKQNSIWEAQKHKAAKENKGDWEQIDPQTKQQVKKDWQAIERKPKPVEEKKWEAVEAPKKKSSDTTEWVAAPKPDVKNENAVQTEKPDVAPTPPTPSKEPLKINPTDLRELGILTLAFRPTWHAREETINAYVACPFRKMERGVVRGEQVYSEDMSPQTILDIDRGIAEQAALHIKQTKQIDAKKIILSFHLQSMISEKDSSPLKALRELDETLRRSIWLEVVGLSSNTSPSKVSTAISVHRDKFDKIGFRLELGDVSRSLVERSKADFLSCDVEASNTHGLQMHSLEQDLPDLLNIAKAHKMEVCTWGLRNHDDLITAIKSGSALINGHVLAKEIRRPGRITPVPAGKLLMK